MMKRSLPLTLLLVALTSGSSWAADAAAEKPQPAPAPAQPSLDARVTRLEQILKSQSLLDMLSQIETLQNENRQLRGELEQQAHANDELKQRLDDVYRDLDRRVSQLERSGVANGGQAAAAGDANAQQQNNAERDAYQKAFEQLRDLHYDQAVMAFDDFLKHYPNGSYALNAHYWLAEASYARRDFARAISEYSTLTERFPDSPKVPEVMLKIGYSYNELGKSAEAKQAFEDLLARFPLSHEAQQAQVALQGLAGDKAKGQ